MRWLLLALASTQAFSATLRGYVETGDSKLLSGAKVVVIHELSMVMVQRITSDRNGFYQASLAPGPYRLMVLKKGFHPLVESVILPAERSSLELHHVLESEMSVSTRDLSDIKHILRKSNREPHKDLTVPDDTLQWVSPVEPRDDSLQGSMVTRALHDLSGEMSYVSEFELATRIKNFEIDTSVVHAKREASGESMQLGTQVMVPVRNWSIAIEASRIDATDSSLTREGTQTVALKGAHSGALKSETVLRFRESRLADYAEDHYALQQHLSHRVGESRLDHVVTAQTWASPEAEASLSEYRACWNQEANRLAVTGQITMAESFGERASQAALHIAGTKDITDNVKLRGQVGVTDQSSILHDHQIQARYDGIALFGTFRDQQQYQALTEVDVFGRHLVNPLTPHMVDGLIGQSTRETSLGFELPLGDYWRSQVVWEDRSNHANLIGEAQGDFRRYASSSSESWALAVMDRRNKREFNFGLSNHQGDDLSYRQRQLRYRQDVSPFRQGQVRLAFEVTVAEHPQVPFWWLLRDVPWNTEQSSTYYEGNLRMLF